MLQWGRDVSIPEISCSGWSAGRLRFASMGPGCFHPRNLRERERRCPNTLLQWGRDVSIPEITLTKRCGAWSLRFNGAGMFPSQKFNLRLQASSPAVGFNGAGMFPSQKYLAQAASTKDLEALQWGRDVSIPEMIPALAVIH